MANNIKFSYLYRDGYNYKNFDRLIFANPTGVDILALESLIRSKLISKTWFYAKDWNLSDLKTNTFDFEIDPTWHEFESVECTTEPVNSPIVLTALISLIQNTHWLY